MMVTGVVSLFGQVATVIVREDDKGWAGDGDKGERRTLDGTQRRGYMSKKTTRDGGRAMSMEEMR